MAAKPDIIYCTGFTQTFALMTLKNKKKIKRLCHTGIYCNKPRATMRTSPDTRENQSLKPPISRMRKALSSHWPITEPRSFFYLSAVSLCCLQSKKQRLFFVFTRANVRTNCPKPQRYDAAQIPDGDEPVSEITRWPRLIFLQNRRELDLNQLNGLASISRDLNRNSYSERSLGTQTDTHTQSRTDSLCETELTRRRNL